MAQIQHNAIPDNQLHEPKGVASASSGTVYKANGSGSGTWDLPAGGAYGEIYIAGGATSFALPAAQEYAKLDPGSAWDDNGALGVTLSGDTGEITVLTGGAYLTTFWMCFDTASLAAGAVYRFKYAVNGVLGSRMVSVQKSTSGVDNLHVSATGIVTLAANDVLSMYAAGNGTSSGTNIIPTEAGLNVVLLKAS